MIYFCGDTHNRIDIHYLNKWYHRNNHLISEDDILIQLGDWGALWHNYGTRGFKRDQVLQCKWAKKKFQLLVVPGNHENYDLIEKLPRVEAFGGIARVLTPKHPYSEKEYKNIYLLERGEIYTIKGRTFLALGGALSIDKVYRTVRETWWPQELWTSADETRCLENLDKVSWKVDYVVSHTAPTSIVGKLSTWKLLDPTSKFFQHLLDKGLEFKHWYFGHFHTDWHINSKFTCVYTQVIPLEEG